MYIQNHHSILLLTSQNSFGQKKTSLLDDTLISLYAKSNLTLTSYYWNEMHITEQCIETDNAYPFFWQNSFGQKNQAC